MFATRLMMLRLSRQLNQKQLAERLGLQKSTVSNWENNNALPSVETLMTLADFFKVSTDYLLGRDESQSDGINHMDVTGLTAQQIEHIQQLVNDLRERR